MSKLSFQYGFSVFLMTLVVRVCSPLIVATAKGSGNPAATSVSDKDRRGVYIMGIRTEHIALVEAIGGNDCVLSASLVLRRPPMGSCSPS